MKVVCAWCRREGRPGLLGEREPLDNPAETHGICPYHTGRLREQVPARSFPGVRVLLVVATSETSLYRYLERSFATVRDVKVILERRQSERRARPCDSVIERRRRERRRRPRTMSPLGYQMVRFAVGPATPPTATELPAPTEL